MVCGPQKALELKVLRLIRVGIVFDGLLSAENLVSTALGSTRGSQAHFCEGDGLPLRAVFRLFTDGLLLYTLVLLQQHIYGEAGLHRFLVKLFLKLQGLYGTEMSCLPGAPWRCQG